MNPGGLRIDLELSHTSCLNLIYSLLRVYFGYTSLHFYIKRIRKQKKKKKKKKSKSLIFLSLDGSSIFLTFWRAGFIIQQRRARNYLVYVVCMCPLQDLRQRKQDNVLWTYHLLIRRDPGNLRANPVYFHSKKKKKKRKERKWVGVFISHFLILFFLLTLVIDSITPWSYLENRRGKKKLHDKWD